MPQKYERMTVTFDEERYDDVCPECSTVGKMSVPLVRPFASESGRYELALDQNKIRCPDCGASYENTLELTDDLRDKIDEKFNEKYEGVTSQHNVE